MNIEYIIKGYNEEKKAIIEVIEKVINSGQICYDKVELLNKRLREIDICLKEIMEKSEKFLK